MPLLRVVRNGLNIVVLFSALVLTPLLALSHFSTGLANMLGDFSQRYLPRPTVFSAEKKTRLGAQTELQRQRAFDARERGLRRKAATATNKVAGSKGKRILIRGAGAMAVGWIPVLGVAADVASLSADYADVCSLFASIDQLSALLYLPDSNLYGDNYCDVPEQGIEILQETARNTAFPWDPAPTVVYPPVTVGADREQSAE